MRYTDDRDRALAERKMRVVMGIARSKGISQLILGAWGCGAYGNPINEIAPLWRKVLLGSAETNTKGCQDLEAITDKRRNHMEIVFAIRGTAVAQAFAQHFGDGLEIDEYEQSDAISGSQAEEMDRDSGDRATIEGLNKIAQLEAQITHAQSPILRERLQAILTKLKEDNG